MTSPSLQRNISSDRKGLDRTFGSALKGERTPEERSIACVAAAPVPGYAMHSLACQQRRNIPVYVISKKALNFRSNESNLMRDVVDAKICGRYLKHRLLRVENLNDILNCRPSAEKLTRSLDLLAVPGYKALIAVLKDHMSENYETIMAKFLSFFMHEPLASTFIMPYIFSFTSSQMLRVESGKRFYHICGHGELLNH